MQKCFHTSFIGSRVNQFCFVAEMVVNIQNGFLRGQFIQKQTRLFILVSLDTKSTESWNLI